MLRSHLVQCCLLAGSLPVLVSTLHKCACACRVPNAYLASTRYIGRDVPEAPLIVFINSRSGGHAGPRLTEALRRALGQSQARVFQGLIRCTLALLSSRLRPLSLSEGFVLADWAIPFWHSILSAACNPGGSGCMCHGNTLRQACAQQLCADPRALPRAFSCGALRE